MWVWPWHCVIASARDFALVCACLCTLGCLIMGQGRPRAHGGLGSLRPLRFQSRAFLAGCYIAVKTAKQLSQQTLEALGERQLTCGLINNRSFLSLSPQDFLSQSCRLNGNKVFLRLGARFSPRFPSILLVSCFESTCFLLRSGSSVCVCLFVFIWQFNVLDFLSLSLFFFFPQERSGAVDCLGLFL